MPNRLIKDSIKHSCEIDSLSWFQEVCFYRLMVTVDDFGCYFANPQIIKSDLFPTKEDLTKATVQEALDRLEEVGLIERYGIDGREYLHICKWDEHQQRRATKPKYPLPPENNCNQVISNDINCPRNTIYEDEYVNVSEDGDESFIDKADAMKIVHEHDRLINAAENSGFSRNDATRKMLIDLYAEHGLEKMLTAIEACVRNGVSTIAYLQGVLKGKPKKAGGRPSKIVSAQEYTQREYDDEQEEARQRFLASV